MTQFCVLGVPWGTRLRRDGLDDTERHEAPFCTTLRSNRTVRGNRTVYPRYAVVL